MNCQDARMLIHGYVDGELDLVKSLEVEQHIQECAACAQALANIRAVRVALKKSSLYVETPPDLARRIRSTVRGASRVDHPYRVNLRRFLAIAASLAFVAAAGWGLARALPAQSDEAILARELVASHVRSQMLATHRFDIASSDPHTVKPWFEGKLDFAPPVKDLTDRSFALIGGRLDYLHDRPVAALVYQRRKHSINVFLWPSTSSSKEAAKTVTRQGYHLIRTDLDGMTCWVVSDLNERELHEFVRLLQE